MKLFDKKIGFFEIILFLILVYIFNYITYSITSDIPQHVDFLISYENNLIPLPANFLYYYTIYAISFFSINRSVLLLVAVYTLAFATLWKYFLVKNIFLKEIKHLSSKSAVIATATATFLIFSFSSPIILLLIDYDYLLSYPANIWHNSTMIFVMPFALLLFWESSKQLSDFSWKRMFIITILIVLNIVAKPSFLFVYAIAFPLLLIKKYRFSKLFWINLIPILVTVLLILCQYYSIYLTDVPQEAKSSVAIDFFHLFFAYLATKNFPFVILVFFVTIISSFLFPIILFIKNKQLLKIEMVQFAILCVVVGIVIGITFYETGFREFDGNFLWQSIIASFILFFVCVLQLLKLVFNGKNGWKKHKTEIGFFIFHFISGIYYLSRLFTDGGYG